MKSVFHASDDRGKANHGWLQAKHSFSFANYYNPKKNNFGALRVFNDDLVAPKMGFGTHPHDNMEIVTIILEGEISHKDSMGNQVKITKDEVQIMSAGSGITHSEFNNHPTQTLSLFQLWIMPQKHNIQPRYGQIKLNFEDRNNTWDTFIDPNPSNLMWINQKAYISRAFISANKTLAYDLQEKNNGVYFFMISGNAQISDHQLLTRDALGVWEFDSLQISASKDTEILAIEVPMIF